MSIISVHNLTKQFGDFTAVNNISFDLEPGEVLGFLGPNGAGKTTTIQMLLGVLTPSGGEILYGKKEFSKHREEILEDVNFSSTYTNLPWNLTVHENLTYISYLYQLENRKERINTVVEIFKLQALLKQPLHELSAGQLTRINLAKAFINLPKILLLDEPTASLDPDIAQFVRDFLLEEQKKYGLSIMFTSHNMPEVEAVCDRVLFINSGKIIANDTPENLAKTLDISKIHLFIKKIDHQKLFNFCKETSIPYSEDAKYITLEVKEKNIAKFLQDLTKKEILFDEISIDKPSLEDYFLHNARKSDTKSFDTIT